MSTSERDHPTTTERDPFILDRPIGRRLLARHPLICGFVAGVLLLLIEGTSIRNSGQRMEPGVERTVVLAVGRPAGWLAERLPLADLADSVTAALSPDDDLTGPGGFESDPAANGAAPAASGTAAAPITRDSFDPAELGVAPQRLPKLETLLATGDSLVQPLDVQLARRLAGDGVRAIREAHLGTGISKSAIVDWGLLSTQQVRQRRPEAVVMFLGANEGFPFRVGGRRVQCCGADWAVIYATRARRMMQTYRRNGAARVYWLTLPLPRDPARQEIARVVNAAIEVAAQPFRSHVRVLDMASVFTPGGRYRVAMNVDGRETIVRRPDGIHLNDAGASVALDIVLARLRQDFASLG